MHIKKTNHDYKTSLLKKEIKYYNALATLESEHSIIVNSFI